AEVRHADRKRNLAERDVVILGERIGRTQSQDHRPLFVLVTIGELATRPRCEEASGGRLSGLARLGRLAGLSLAGDDRAERRNGGQAATLSCLSARLTRLTRLASSATGDETWATEVVLDIEVEVDADAF